MSASVAVDEAIARVVEALAIIGTPDGGPLIVARDNLVSARKRLDNASAALTDGIAGPAPRVVRRVSSHDPKGPFNPVLSPKRSGGQ